MPKNEERDDSKDFRLPLPDDSVAENADVAGAGVHRKLGSGKAMTNLLSSHVRRRGEEPRAHIPLTMPTFQNCSYLPFKHGNVWQKNQGDQNGWRESETAAAVLLYRDRARG
jgi:hypothetical protein